MAGRGAFERSSLRVRLASSYAGLALLSVVVVGAVLLVVLGQHYRQSEDRYLEAVASRAAVEFARNGATLADLSRRASIVALTTQTRVRVFDASGVLVADSGLPTDIDPETLAPPADGFDRRSGDELRGLPSPLGSGIFGSADMTDAPRSDRVLRTSLRAASGDTLGTLLLSDGPASGSDVMQGVREVLGIAVVIAMLLAAMAGYVVSGRISGPLVELTDASDRMAEGDLSARSAVGGDDEVGRLAASFNTMADRIEATVMTLRRFVADAAHEIGTPLTALQADLELADAARSESEEREFVKRALAQARRIEDLSANLLRLSRLEAGETAVAADEVDVVRLASEAVDGAASKAEQAGLELRAVLPESPVAVRGDSAKLLVVVENLLDNAVKFTAEGGAVEVGVAVAGSEAVVWVADTGVGIPAREQHEVFSRFYRARNVAAYPGSGLGLAIVHATVEAHGGTIGFRSDEGGTRFEIRLPLHAPVT